MSDLSKFGLVIQGPLTSSGLTGAGTRETFDCMPNILQLVNSHAAAFGEIVVSTWEDEDQGKLAILEAAGVRVIRNAPLTSEMSHAAKMRQYVSTLSGIEALSNGLDYVCKVRSDQSFDVARFCVELLEANSCYRDFLVLGRRGFIQGLFLSLRRPFGLSDFAIVGHLDEVRAFYIAQWGTDPVADPANDWVEGDAVKRFLLTLKNSLPIRDDVFFFPPLPRLLDRPVRESGVYGASESSFRLWETALRSVFSVSSREIMADFRYRGHLLQPSLQTYNGHRAEWQQLRLDFPAQLNSLVGEVVRVRPPLSWRLYRRGGAWTKLYWWLQTAKRTAALRRLRRLFSRWRSCL